MPKNQRLTTIGQFAKLVGVPTTTLRYYEREEILCPTVRNGAGYRLYDTEALGRLQFVRSAQAVGFTLDDIRKRAQLDPHDKNCCQADVQRLLEARLAELDERMKELKRVRETLGRALDRCRRSTGECPVLNDLNPRKKQRR